MLWPSAGKGGQNVAVHAQTHNMFVAANGNGENFDRLGRAVLADVSFNYTLPRLDLGDAVNCFHPPCKPPHHGPVLITVSTLDLDSSLIFFGGPGAKKDVIEAFIADGEAKHGVASVYRDDVVELQLLACVRPDCRARAALQTAGITTRREERTRNRLTNNRLRRRDVHLALFIYIHIR